MFLLNVCLSIDLDHITQTKDPLTKLSSLGV